MLPHLDAIYRTALRMTRSPDRAAEAVQETMLRAWKYFDTFNEGREAKAWLFTILRNTVYEAARRRKREGATASIDEYGPEQIPGRAPPVPETLTDEEVIAAIEKLPEDFRLVTVMALVEDMKYREIAEVLEIPIGTVMSRLHRGRQLLRGHLSSYARREGLRID